MSSEWKNEALNRIREAVVKYDEVSAVELVKKALKAGLDPETVIARSLIPAMREVGSLFAREEMFIPEVMITAEVFNVVMKILKPKIAERGERLGTIGRVIIGTTAGDIHDLGKNLVATMLMTAGFEVIDLGRDVTTEMFVQKVRELEPDILAMSALMTTTMLEQRKVIEALIQEGLRRKVKIVVGGAPTTSEWAEMIGADGYAPDAFEAVELAKELIGAT